MNAETELTNKLNGLTQDFPGEVGIAMISQDDTISINGNGHFPLFSVMKFHQALAVSEKKRNNQASLAKGMKPGNIRVSPEDLKPGTWSPMRENNPEGGTYSINQLLEYTLIESDNNACDILFKYVAGPAYVDSFIHSLGINDCAITWTEEEQHADMSRYLDNWTTPLSAARLLEKINESASNDEYTRFIWRTMAKCQTGINRIPKYIADSTISIIHKTGTGGILPDGKIMGINDIACIVLPNGKHFELAVFIKDASCGPADCEELIANIAKVCMEYVVNERHAQNRKTSLK